MKRALVVLALLATPLALASGACTEEADPLPASVANEAGAAVDAAPATDLPVPVQLDAGEAGPVSCGTTACPPADYQGIATLAACCTSASTCGLDLTGAAAFVPVGPGCFAPAAPGVSDDTRPSYTTERGELQGCCRSDKTCGVFVRLTPTIDLGCVAPKGFAPDAGPAQRCDVADSGGD